MKTGVFLPHIGESATKGNVLYVATEAEKRGLDSLWVLDRMLFPINPRTPYGGTPDGHLPVEYKNVFDPLGLLSFVAGHTESILLGTSVIDMLFQTPVNLGRRLATLDVLSEGRVVAGLGLGWSKDEYEAANVPFEHKGARADEFLQAMKNVWTKDIVEFSGHYYKIAPSNIGPKPVQRPHPPVLLGGFTPKTFERIVKYADGWMGVAAMPIPQLEQIITGLKNAASAGGKNPMIYMLAFPFVGQKMPEESRGPMTGSVDQVGRDIEKLKKVHVDHIVLATNAFTPIGNDPQKILDTTVQLAGYAK